MMPSRLTSQACSNTIAAGIGAIDHGDAGEPHSEDGAEASEFVSAPSILSRGFKSVGGAGTKKERPCDFARIGRQHNRCATIVSQTPRYFFCRALRALAHLLALVFADPRDARS
jgi:hypothetical protein